MAVATAGAWFYTLVLFQPLSPLGVAGAAVLQWLLLVALAAVTFVGSVLTRSSLAAAGLGIAAFIVLGILGAFPAIARFVPSGLAAPARALALGTAGPDPWTPLVATVVLIAAAGLLSWLAFREQEL